MSIPDFSRSKVLVVGDVMLDRYWYGGASRISPEAPVPVVHVGSVDERPGGAGNVAHNLATLGTQVTLLGLFGADAEASNLEKLLEGAGVRCKPVRLESRPTVMKLRVVSQQQQLIRLDFEQGFSDADAERLEEPFRTALSEADVLILSDYGKGTLRKCRELIEISRAQGVPVLVDPKGTDFARYREATVVTPNLSEFEAVVGKCSNDREIEERGANLLERLALDALLITRGERGMTLVQAKAQPVHLPTQAREVFDVTGAGDTVISVLASGIAAGASLIDAVRLANLAGGIVVGRLGTASVTVAEIESALHRAGGREPGVIPELEQILGLVRKARAQGERVVMTNGCFDILHAGHVRYLREARELGDRLLVAVNDDASVQRLKGPTRPVNALGDRMDVLASLECVDWVVPFSEDTPAELISQIQPNVLVKGGDYRVEDVVGHDIVAAAGGEVRVLSLWEGRSTTRIVEGIRGAGEGR